jgi:hypothetical protein
MEYQGQNFLPPLRFQKAEYCALLVGLQQAHLPRVYVDGWVCGGRTISYATEWLVGFGARSWCPELASSFALRVNGRIYGALTAWHAESLVHYRERNLSTSCQVSAPIERVSAP